MPLAQKTPFRLKLALFVALVAPLAASSALAQQPVKRNSTIIGVAEDSLHKRPLGGAEVMIAGGVNRTIVTDALGRFRVDSLPAGIYQVGIFHPLLDSLGITLASPEFALGPDSASLVRLSIPSAATLVAQNCKARMRTLGNAAIFGRLLDPDTFEPVPKAEVSIVWVQFEASKATGVHQTPRLIRDSTDSNGTFRLCGLPAELDARLQASYKGVVTADVPVYTSAEDGDFVIRPLYISRSDSTHAGRASVVGRVTFADGRPAAGSHVEIVGTKAAALVNEKGEFSLVGAPSGTQMLLVRRLGWEPREVPVDLSATRPQRVTVQLRKFVPVMDAVVVTAKTDKALEGVGFTSRQKSGMGKYITAAEIERRNPPLISDLLRTVPGLSVQQRGFEQVVVSTRGTGTSQSGCVTYFVDGTRFQPVGGEANDFINPREVVGIEVYDPSFVPGQFAGPAGTSCTTVVVWTKTRVH